MRYERIIDLLPNVFQRTISPGSPIAGLLRVMEGLHAPSEHVIAGFDQYLDPYRAPDEFIPFLAGWVNLDSIFGKSLEKSLGRESHDAPRLENLRELIARASYLSQWRGTKKSLLLVLRAATGIMEFEIDERALDESGQAIPFHIRITADGSAKPYKGLLERLIESEKPVYVTYELLFTESKTN